MELSRGHQHCEGFDARPKCTVAYVARCEDQQFLAEVLQYCPISGPSLFMGLRSHIFWRSSCLYRGLEVGRLVAGWF